MIIKGKMPVKIKKRLQSLSDSIGRYAESEDWDKMIKAMRLYDKMFCEWYYGQEVICSSRI